MTARQVVRYGVGFAVEVDGETASEIVRQMNTCAYGPGWIVFQTVAGHEVRIWSAHLIALEPSE